MTLKAHHHIDLLAIAFCTRSIVTRTRHIFQNPTMPLSSSLMKTLNGEEEEVHGCLKLCFELQKRMCEALL